MEVVLENDFEQLHPECTRKVELRKRISMEEHRNEKGINNDSDDDSDDSEQWADEGRLSFLHEQEEWGNDADGNDWLATQRKLKPR
jgi:hypothetical protein